MDIRGEIIILNEKEHALVPHLAQEISVHEAAAVASGIWRAATELFGSGKNDPGRTSIEAGPIIAKGFNLVDLGDALNKHASAPISKNERMRIFYGIND